MRVHISGYGVLSSLGNSPDAMFSSLLENRSAVKLMEDWSRVQGLHCRLGAPVMPYDNLVLPRTARRTMSTMSEMAALASMQALELAGVKISDLNPERSLLSLGSTTGSPATLEEYFNRLSSNQGSLSQSGTAFFKIMNHSVASNVL